VFQNRFVSGHELIRAGTSHRLLPASNGATIRLKPGESFLRSGENYPLFERSLLPEFFAKKISLVAGN
jgi:hypothetical protein